MNMDIISTHVKRGGPFVKHYMVQYNTILNYYFGTLVYSLYLNNKDPQNRLLYHGRYILCVKWFKEIKLLIEYILLYAYDVHILDAIKWIFFKSSIKADTLCIFTLFLNNDILRKKYKFINVSKYNLDKLLASLLNAVVELKGCPTFNDIIRDKIDLIDYNNVEFEDHVDSVLIYWLLQEDNMEKCDTLFLMNSLGTKILIERENKW